MKQTPTSQDMSKACLKRVAMPLIMKHIPQKSTLAIFL